jgi:putrescine transport system ATP-binding protein
MPQQTNYSDRPWLDADAEPFIKLRSVSKKFGEFTAVDNIDLDIYKGELFSLLGGSGCGKTTLLRMLAGFEPPSSGTIYIDGVDMTDVPPYARPINMMFQSYALFPHMTVEQNVAYGLNAIKFQSTKLSAVLTKFSAWLNYQISLSANPINFRVGSANVWPLPVP